MKIKYLKFPGFVFGQSGVQGFYGEGDEYRHHWLFKFLWGLIGFSFRDIVFVAKTVTLKPRIYPKASNTKLREGYKLKDFFPSSIWCSLKSFFKGYMLNAVGLANRGLARMLHYYKWQLRDDVFQLSIMLMETTLEAKKIEAREICRLLRFRLPLGNKHRYALQINFSCPNTGHEQKQDAEDIIQILKIFHEEIPQLLLIPKFDLLVEPETISKLKSYCDAFCVANTLAFGKKQNPGWWNKLFKDGISPLVKRLGKEFPGGLSGAPLFPILVEWLAQMQSYDPEVIIIAGGGIMNKKDIKTLSHFKIVHGVALGSVAILRPWRLRGLIRYGNKLFQKKQKN